MKIGSIEVIEVKEEPDELGLFQVIFLETGKRISRWETLEKAKEIGESWASELNGEPKPWACNWNGWSVEKRKKYAREGLI